MTRLRTYMEAAKAKGKKLFVAYIAAGDPGIEQSLELCSVLVENGTDIIELGVPFSDPIGDGATNQAAAERALAAGMNCKGVIDLAAKIRNQGLKVPIVLFTYYNPIYKYGIQKFTQDAAEAGVDGILCVDLPPEEADNWNELMNQAELGTVFLASPTTPPDRLKKIDESSTGFVYYVSRTGVTGAQSDISVTLDQEMANVIKNIMKPVVVGFGLSTPEQVAQVAKLGDGVVVGSAIVKKIEQYGKDMDQLKVKLGSFVSELSAATRS